MLQDRAPIYLTGLRGGVRQRHVQCGQQSSTLGQLQDGRQLLTAILVHAPHQWWVADEDARTIQLLVGDIRGGECMVGAWTVQEDAVTARRADRDAI